MRADGLRTYSLRRAVVAITCMVAWFTIRETFAQQIMIPRIESMPDLPSPYQMRDWKAVARGYDSFVFDFGRTGTYLPLGWRVTNTVNYPGHGSFGLTTVVGTPRVGSAEAINVLPALVGATLVGIDKSLQSGENWVLMAEEFFNRRPEENIYLNLPVTQSGDDWWYETMPNVFFYQLNDLYPATGDFEHQFTTVADQWLRAVQAMGGAATPWRVPSMNYRAWSFSTMRPLASGVREPEAAGAIAWILYNAYAETADDDYRLGAEWAIEYLNRLTSNPAYELQLAYGVYAAARMNAELRTNYDVEKLVNWCFNIGPLRSWGSLLGTWGGYDVHGLIGEESSNDYAFLMNGFQQAAALVPMTRYDDRFAHAIAKWTLNLANATRLFYPNYLPAANQDSEQWSYQYDPSSYIGHEAIRQYQNSVSPYATGDAVGGGWGYTNLTLYSSSHVGYLASIVDMTDVPGILKLDVLATDFYRAPAYPSYLLYNPHPEDRLVSVDVGTGAVDLYDAVSNQWLAAGVSGVTSVSVAPGAALLLVLAPAGGQVTYDLDRLLVDDVVVDYRAGVQVTNEPPRIKALAAAPDSVFLGAQSTVYCTADDRDGDALSYLWTSDAGSISGEGSSVVWTPPAGVGSFRVACRVDDGRGGVADRSVTLSTFANHVPVIASLTADPGIVELSGTTQIVCDASDEDGDPLQYLWSSDAGALIGGGSEVTWTAPPDPGYYLVYCAVSDGSGGEAQDSTGVVVGSLVADLPFDGDPADRSGFGNDALVSGARLTADRFGNPARAYAFDGVDDALTVPSHPSLDFRDETTVAVWMKADRQLQRESFLVSHGSWQNRWKISLTPEQRIRWTVKTTRGIKDLDSVTPIVVDSTYHVVGTYGGGLLRLYLNGRMDAQSAWSGTLLATGLDLTIGQMVPGSIEWNFSGVLDDVRIYNRALSDPEVAALYGGSSPVEDGAMPASTTLHAPYPNPFVDAVTLDYEVDRPGDVSIRVYDVVGRLVRSIASGPLAPGRYRVDWDGRDAAGARVASGVYLLLLKSGSQVDKRTLVRMRTN